MAALDKFWNQFCSKRKDIILVICGSAASWIINKIINNKGGLHNRLTCQIQLLPFDIKETKEYLQAKRIRLVDVDIIKLYMVIGGIPYYLRYFEKGQSVDQFIERMFFSKQALFKSEFDNLYASLFKNSHNHIKIVKALSLKNKGLTRNEILTSTKLASGGGFSLIIQELILCGFVKEITPIGNKKDDTLYRLIDEFTLFYYKFIEPTRNKNNWVQFATTQVFKIWQGFSFENFVFKHITLIKKELGINGIVTNEASWFYKGNHLQRGAQIDLIIDRSDNCMNLLEAKFYNTEFSISKDYYETIKNKKAVFVKQTRTKKNVFYTMVSVNGVTENNYYLSVITNQINIASLM